VGWWVDGLVVWWFRGLVGWWIGGLVGWWVVVGGFVGWWACVLVCGLVGWWAGGVVVIGWGQDGKKHTAAPRKFLENVAWGRTENLK
jgi:hypothetical protein